MTGQVRTDQVRTGQVRAGQGKTGQFKKVQVRTGFRDRAFKFYLGLECGPTQSYLFSSTFSFKYRNYRIFGNFLVTFVS